MTSSDLPSSDSSPRYPLTTVGALVTSRANRILIVKTTKWRGSWGVPGGKVEWGETLTDALVREFQEEVGLKLSHIRWAILQEAALDPQFFKEAHFIMANYFAFAESEEVSPNEEIVEWAWVSPQTASTYPLNSYTQILLQDYLHQDMGTFYQSLS